MNQSLVRSLPRCWVRLTPLLAAVLALPSLPRVAATPEPGAALVRVQLSLAGETLVAQSAAAWECCCPAAADARAELPPGGELTLSARGNRVEWRAGANTWQTASALLVASHAEGQITLTAGRLSRQICGAAEVFAANGRLQIVAEVPLERYVAAVLAREASPSFHPEALKAMAVAARTYVLRAVGKHAPWADVCDTTHCQSFSGTQPVAPALEAAARETAGVVALYDGKPIDAVYSTDCGGHTEASEFAWSGGQAVPYLRPIPDRPAVGAEAYCAIHRGHTWRLTLAAERLRRLGHLPAGSQPRCEVIATTASGRAQQVRIRAAGEREGRIFSGEEWRRALGSPLHSLRFQVTMNERGDALLTGTGWGHGVGLCQWGAQGYARSAAAPSFREILQHYYRGIQLEEQLEPLTRRPRYGAPRLLLASAWPAW